MLTVHTAEPWKSQNESVCPMLCSVFTLNFVSQLRLARMQPEPHEGPLSLKFVFKGREMYHVDGTRLPVEEDSYLLLNDRQRYASSIDSATEIDSFCIWFRSGFIEQVYHAMRTRADLLLDAPNSGTPEKLLFFDRLYKHDDIVTPVVSRMRAAVIDRHADMAWLDEQFHLLGERLLHAQRNAYREVEMLPAARHATRVELYRRLHRARDYVEANLTENVTLADAAGVAALSPHHFLRSFKKVFQETPGQYQVRRRMEMARDLLLRTDTPVTQICFDLGFESLGTFSWRFRNHYGLPPSAYRAARGEQY